MADERASVDLPLQELEDLTWNALLGIGLTESDAEIIRDVLLYAELRDNSQSLVKIVEGVLTPVPGAGEIEVTRTGAAALTINANQNIGMVVAHRAAREVALLAKTTGVAVAASRNVSTSTGAIGYYADMMAREGLIGMVMCGSPKVMAMAGGIDPVFGTNPVAIAAPTSGEPIVLDMATSAITFFEIVNAARQGVSIPEHAAFDSEGRPTTDPNDALQGAMRVFDGFKSAGLALMFEILTGPLAGAGVAGDEDQGTNRGAFFMAIDPAMFAGRDAYLAAADRMASRIRSGRPERAGEEITLPGDRGRARVEEKREQGFVSLDKALVDELRALAAVE